MVGMHTGINTRQGCRHICQFAFDYAISKGRKKVSVVHKANIMKAMTAIFLETVREMYEKDYKGRFELEEIIVDACAMKLAAAMMLDHVNRSDLGDRLRQGIDDMLNIDKVRTGDLGGKATTREFADALVKRIQAA